MKKTKYTIKQIKKMLMANTKDKQLDIANELNITINNLAVKRSTYKKMFPEFAKYYKSRIKARKFHQNKLYKSPIILHS